MSSSAAKTKTMETNDSEQQRVQQKELRTDDSHVEDEIKASDGERVGRKEADLASASQIPGQQHPQQPRNQCGLDSNNARRTRALSEDSAASNTTTTTHVRLFRSGSFDLEVETVGSSGGGGSANEQGAASTASRTSTSATIHSSSPSQAQQQQQHVDFKFSVTSSPQHRHHDVGDDRNQQHKRAPVPPPPHSPVAAVLTHDEERSVIDRIVNNISSVDSITNNSGHAFDESSAPDLLRSTEFSSLLLASPVLTANPDAGHEREFGRDNGCVIGLTVNGDVGNTAPASSPGRMTRSSLDGLGWSSFSSIYRSASTLGTQSSAREGTHASPGRIEASPQQGVRVAPPAPPPMFHAHHRHLGVSLSRSMSSTASSSSSSLFRMPSRLASDNDSGHSSTGSLSSSKAHHLHGRQRVSGSTAVVTAMKALQNKITMLETERDAVIEKCDELEHKLAHAHRQHDRSTAEATRAAGVDKQRAHDAITQLEARARRAEEKTISLQEQLEFVKVKTAESETARVDAASRASVLERRLSDLRLRLQRAELMHAQECRSSSDRDEQVAALREALSQQRQRFQKTAKFVQNVLGLNETLVAKVQAMEATLQSNSPSQRRLDALQRSSGGGAGHATPRRGVGSARRRGSMRAPSDALMRPTSSTLAKQHRRGQATTRAGAAYVKRGQMRRSGQRASQRADGASVAKRLTDVHLQHKNLHQELVEANLNRRVPFVLGAPPSGSVSSAVHQSHSIYVRAQRNLGDANSYGAAAWTNDDLAPGAERQQQQQQQQHGQGGKMSGSVRADESDGEYAGCEDRDKGGTTGDAGADADSSVTATLDEAGVLVSVQAELRHLEQQLQVAREHGEQAKCGHLAGKLEVKRQQLYMLERYLQEAQSRNEKPSRRADIHSRDVAAKEVVEYGSENFTQSRLSHSQQHSRSPSPSLLRPRLQSQSRPRSPSASSRLAQPHDRDSARPRSPLRTPEAYEKKVRTLQILSEFRREEERGRDVGQFFSSP